MGKEVRPATEDAGILRPPERPDDLGALPEDTPGAFVRHSAIMSVGTALSRLTGFLRVAAMAFALGVAENRIADAYNVANTTPNIVYELALGGILSSVFVPVFVGRMSAEGRDAAWHTARTVLTVALIVLGTIMVVGIVFSGAVIRLYTFRVQGPEGEAERALATFLLKWFMPQIVFYGLGAGIATGLLNAHRRFAAPMFAPILNNLIVVATFFTFVALPGPTQPSPTAITSAQRYVLAIGTTLGVAAMTIALWPALRRLGFRWRWTVDLKDPGLRRLVRLSGWALLYVVVNQLGLLVVIVLASPVRGGYTAYTAAFIFFQLPYAIFAVSIITALLPSLSGLWARGETAGFRGQLVQGVRGTAFVVIPAALGYLALAVPIVRLLLQHGVMQARSTDLVAGVLQFFSIGLFSFAAFQVFLRAFYAMQDTRTPALINIVAVGLNTLVNLLFFRLLKVEGLALGHATAYTFAAITAAVILRRRMGGFEGRRLGAAVAKIAVGGLAAGGAAWLVARGIQAALGTATLTAQLAQVGGGVLAGLGAFLAVALLLRMQELALLRDLLLARTRPR